MSELVAGWSREFDEPIALPEGRKLVVLRDAANYIAALPAQEAALPEWQAAIEALILVADLGGPTMFARIGVMRALNRHHVGSSIRREKNRIGGGGNSRGTGCDLVHILDPKVNDSLEMMVQINSNNEVGSCPPYSTSSTANTAVPASPKCGNNF